MVTRPSHYEILGISDNADLKTIQTAFRNLALIWHPDKEAEWRATLTDDQRRSTIEIFKRIKEAHEVLSNPVKKAAYDRARMLPIQEDSITKQRNDAFCQQWAMFKLHRIFTRANPEDFEQLFTDQFKQIFKYDTEKAQLREELEAQKQKAHQTDAEIVRLRKTLTEEKEKTARLEKELSRIRQQQPTQPGFFAGATPTVKTKSGKIIPEGLQRIIIRGVKEGDQWTESHACELVFQNKDQWDEFFRRCRREDLKISGDHRPREGSEIYMVQLRHFLPPMMDDPRQHLGPAIGIAIFNMLKQFVDISDIYCEYVDLKKNIHERIPVESNPDPRQTRR